MEATKSKSGAIRICGSPTMDVVRFPLSTFRFHMGERPFQVNAPLAPLCADAFTLGGPGTQGREKSSM